MSGRGVGCVVRAAGAALHAALPGARVGDGAVVFGARGALRCEVATVERGRVALIPFGAAAGVAVGDRVELDAAALASVVGFGLLGRALDGDGVPLDGGPPPSGSRAVVRRNALSPFERAPLARPMWTGVRAFDALLVCARGARIGIFGPPGCGKSTLLGTLLKSLEADAVIVAAVGERGREARDWCALLDARTTVICATGERSAAERVRAAELAFAHGAHVRERGVHAVLILDSLTRYATALRELRLAAGEPLGPGGFPPGVWPEMAALLERAGEGAYGSLTVFATVLTDTDVEYDPLALAARSLLDGHVVLSSERAQAGRFPAIDVRASLSRTMECVAASSHLRAAAVVRAALDALAASREMRRAGLLPTDAATAGLEAHIDEFVHDPLPAPPARTLAALHELAERIAARE